MAEVTREVLIKLKIQQLPFRMRTPDISGAQRAAQQIETVYKTAYSNVRIAANSVTNAPLKGIDVSAFTASATQASAVMQAELAKIETQVDSINGKLMQMGSALTQAGAAQPGTGGTTGGTAAEKTPAQLEREYRRAFRSIAAQHRDLQIEMAKTGQSAAQLAGTQPMWTQQQAAMAPVTQGLLQAGEGYKRAGEGAFHLARGIALLNYENEAELAVLLKKLAYYQGLFDVVKGGIDIVSGLVVGTRALRTAYLASAAAANVNATSISVMSVAMNYATASATAMWTAITGPVGLAVLGVTAVVGIATVAWYKYGNAGKEAADKTAASLAKQAEAARIARYDLEKLTQAAQRQKNFEGSSGARASILDLQQGQRSSYVAANVDASLRTQESQIAAAGLQDIQSKLAANQQAMSKQRAAFVEAASRQADIRNRDNFIGQSAGVSVKGFSALDPKKFKPGFAQKLGDDSSLFSSFQKNVQGIANAKPEKFTADVSGQEAIAKVLGRQAELQKTIKTQTESQSKLERDRLTLLGEQRSAVQAIIDKEKSRYEANKQALKEEESRRKTTVQKFGELRPDQQQQLKQLGEQIKTQGISSLNEGQIQQLRESGFGQSILSKRDYAKGTAAGADEFLKNIGEFKPGNATILEEGQGADESRAEFLARMQQDAKAEIAKREAQMATILQQSQQSSANVIDLLKQVADLQPIIDVLQTEIEKRQKQIENLKAEIERVKSSADKAADATRRGQMARTGY